MPRLDVWLVENEYFSSRQKAKRAIRNGYITINGKIEKASYSVKGDEDIKILNPFQDVPIGYKKLHQLEGFLGNSSVWQKSLVLDIGSSAGGFLQYLANKGAKAIGIEISISFKNELFKIVNQFPNISVIFDDAFEMEPSIICQEQELDFLLIDVTTDIEGTLKLIHRFKSLLKIGGYLISAFKTKPDSLIINKIQLKIKELEFINIQKIILDKTLQEFHIIAIRA